MATTTKAKPSVVLIPGSFSPAFLYAPLIKAIQSHGYEARAVDLPTVGDSASASGVSMADDAAHIQSVIAPLVAKGKEVLLVAHSYGGVPATESVKGLAKKEGKEGGVVGIVYITSIVPLLGKSAGETTAGGFSPDWLHLDGLHLSIYPVEEAAPITFSDVPEAVAIKEQAQLSGHSAIAFGGELTHAGYLDVPVWYLVCEEDKILPVDLQRKMVESIKGAGAKVEVESLKCGHCPNVSQPEAVVTLIRRAAGEKI